jgi:predicted RNA-binding protein with PIN domain
VVADHRRRVIVDAMNVIGAVPDGWWRDRAAAQRRFAERLARLPRGAGVEVVVVFEGTMLPDLEEGLRDGIVVLWATRRGPDAADDRIVDEAAASTVPVTVVSSDRALRDRVIDLGAKTVGPSALADAIHADA